MTHFFGERRFIGKRGFGMQLNGGLMGMGNKPENMADRIQRDLDSVRALTDAPNDESSKLMRQIDEYKQQLQAMLTEASWWNPANYQVMLNSPEYRQIVTQIANLEQMAAQMRADTPSATAPTATVGPVEQFDQISQPVSVSDTPEIKAVEQAKVDEAKKSKGEVVVLQSGKVDNAGNVFVYLWDGVSLQAYTPGTGVQRLDPTTLQWTRLAKESEDLNAEVYAQSADTRGAMLETARQNSNTETGMRFASDTPTATGDSQTDTRTDTQDRFAAIRNPTQDAPGQGFSAERGAVVTDPSKKGPVNMLSYSQKAGEILSRAGATLTNGYLQFTGLNKQVPLFNIALSDGTTMQNPNVTIDTDRRTGDLQINAQEGGKSAYFTLDSGLNVASRGGGDYTDFKPRVIQDGQEVPYDEWAESVDRQMAENDETAMA